MKFKKLTNEEETVLKQSKLQLIENDLSKEKITEMT